MAIQLVVKGNRILSYGEACFYQIGETVFCPLRQKVFKNATIVICEDDLPADIDSVGYEYHAGKFVPCAPYGVGGGNIAVVYGEDCKVIMDSSIPCNSIMRYSLLWENASLDSAFSAQTVKLANSDWNFVIVECYDGSIIIPKGGTGMLQKITRSTYYEKISWRTVTAKYDSAEATFSTVYESNHRTADTNPHDFATSTSGLIPLKIYGVIL